MERSGHLNTSEVVGVATATAAALGGIVIALGRAQQHGQRGRLATLEQQARNSMAVPTRAALNRAAGIAEQYPALRHSATDALQRAGERVRPAAEGVTELAAVRAGEMRSAGADALERLRESLVPAAAGAINTLTEQAVHVRERGDATSSSLLETSSHAAEVAVTHTKRATGELFATFAWIGVAATVVYVALLDGDRRRRLRAFLGHVFEQIQTLRSDFAGYEDEI